MADARDAAIAQAVDDLERLVKDTRQSRERAEEAARRTPVLAAGLAAIERDTDARTSPRVEELQERIEVLLIEGSDLLAHIEQIDSRYRTAATRLNLPATVGTSALARLDTALQRYRELHRTPYEGDLDARP